MKANKLTVFLVLAITTTPAVAYIDPGSGSAIISAIIGFFIAIGMAIKTYWYKIKGLFHGKKADPQQDPQKEQQDP